MQLLCTQAHACPLLCSSFPRPAMGVMATPSTNQAPAEIAEKPPLSSSGIPSVDLSAPGAAEAAVRACKDLGFFRLTGHGVPPELTARLEAEAARFFSSPQAEKERWPPGCPPRSPFGYGSKSIGANGDSGWLEYLLLDVTPKLAAAGRAPAAFAGDPPSASSLEEALKQYTVWMRKLAGEMLDKIAEGMEIEPRDALSKLVLDEESDSMLRLNHYTAPPPPPSFPAAPAADQTLTGFGEHTDPQVISILRSNDAAGLQVATRDGRWLSVPPDRDSFFVNVGDSLQVLTNGRLTSVRHRVVVAAGEVSRVSAVYFGGPPPETKLAPVVEMRKEEQRRYREFTWSEYKSSAYKSKLADNRLRYFERHE